MPTRALQTWLKSSSIIFKNGTYDKTQVLSFCGCGKVYKSSAISPKIKSEEERAVEKKETAGPGNLLNQTTTTTTDDGHPQMDLTFANAREAYRSKSTAELLRALVVFNLCSVNTLIERNKELMKMSRKLLGKTLFSKVMKMTFYGHFVAGEDQKEIKPLIARNRTFGVKSILDYSVEEDLSSEQAKEAEMKSCVSEEEISHPEKEGPSRRFRAHREFGDRREGVISARTYFYEGESQCDKNMVIFLNCIDAVSDATDGSGFAAVKLTALGRPQLLLQLSEVLVQTRLFFEKFCGTSGNLLLRNSGEEDFHKRLESTGVSISRDDSHKWFNILGLNTSRESQVDYGREIDLLNWDNLMEVNTNLSKLFVVPNLKTGKLEPLVTALTPKEETEMKNMLHRIDTVAQYASEKKVRVMVDAEQTYFQPAISRLTMEMMRKFNKDMAIIFNTYQCYLKQAFYNITLDLDLAERDDFYFGAKVVRGAYMEQERERAEKLKYEDPINPNYEATTDMYHGVMSEVMRQIKARQAGKIAVMVASHNEDTVRFTVEKMKAFNIRPSDRVICFGQLLGMCDQISFPLGQAGYSVYKYVPYGPVEEVLPYLSRRACENRGILQKVQKEKRLLWSELGRRVLTGQIFYSPTTSPK